MPLWRGSCHCGKVQFEVEAEPAEVTMCDCSLCSRKNAVMFQVKHEQLRVIAGADELTEYRWNTGVARHFFCRTCGIYPFHSKRSAPDSYGVNVHCLEGFDPASLPLRLADGKTMSIV